MVILVKIVLAVERKCEYVRKKTAEGGMYWWFDFNWEKKLMSTNIL